MVTQAKFSEREARSMIESLQQKIGSLEGELNKLQVSVSLVYLQDSFNDDITGIGQC